MSDWTRLLRIQTFLFRCRWIGVLISQLLTENCDWCHWKFYNLFYFQNYYNCLFVLLLCQIIFVHFFLFFILRSSLFLSLFPEQSLHFHPQKLAIIGLKLLSHFDFLTSFSNSFSLPHPQCMHNFFFKWEIIRHFINKLTPLYSRFNF